jgi:epoxyqueuosine reductase
MKRRIYYNPKLTALARELRNNSTLSEVLLWGELKTGKMLGHDFHRQKPIDEFIVDFFCYDLMLAIEIDGSSHDNKVDYDKFRQKKLESLGIRFLRFDDLAVKQKIEFVLKDIRQWIEHNTPPAPPSRGKPEQNETVSNSSHIDVDGNLESTTSEIFDTIISSEFPPSEVELEQRQTKDNSSHIKVSKDFESAISNSSDNIISSEFPPSKGGKGGVERNTKLIKSLASQLGFSFCGIAKAEFLEEEAPRLEEWLKRGYQGKMSYLENHFDKRLDPRLLVPGAKSVISLMYNYYPQKDLAKENPDSLKIAKYAYGEDYHFVIKEKLKTFLQLIQDKVGEVQGRAFVDSAPVHERVWAKKSGLGWVGKNSLLLNREMGSFFFLTEMIVDLELEYDGPIKDYCGTCTACMDACPTDAIPAPYVVDGSKCISYFTIELKEEIPVEVKGKFENWIFGCDICQDVCPWNRFSKPNQEQKFLPHPDLKKMTKEDWREITEDVFEKLFKKSAVKRTKLEGLKRNANFV